jgi:hypothetical protein
MVVDREKGHRRRKDMFRKSGCREGKETQQHDGKRHILLY